MLLALPWWRQLPKRGLDKYRAAALGLRPEELVGSAQPAKVKKVSPRLPRLQPKTGRRGPPL